MAPRASLNGTARPIRPIRAGRVPRRREYITNAALAAFTLLLCLAALEVVLRLTVYNYKSYPVSPGPGAEYHIDTAEFHTTVRTNSLNMRDGEIPPKAPGERRILCLGDSFTFGLGVHIPESYPKVLEGELARAHGNGLSPARVINGGTGGNAHHAHEFLLRQGFEFGPDLVIEQVYIGNDFYDGLGRLAAVPAASAPDEPVSAAPARPGPLQVLKSRLSGLHLRTPEFLWSRLVQLPFFDDWLYRMDLRYDNRGVFLREYPAIEAALERLLLEDLGRIDDACRERGVAFAVLIAPTKQQLFMKRHLDNAKYDYRKPNRTIREFCASRGVPCLDLLEVYESLPEEQVRRLYYSQDRHWTVEGHAQTASRLAAFLSGAAPRGARH